jgi:hypothetical protein
MKYKDKMNIANAFNELNADYDSVEEALFSIEDEVQVIIG